MVWKCCVPGCTSSAKVPAHMLPRDEIKAQAWLRAIGRSDVIDATKEAKDKLRICSLHFSKSMIIPYGQKRRLKDTAMPTLYLSCANIAADIPSTSSADIGSITTLQTSENVEVNSDVAAASAESCEMVQPVQLIVNINKVHMTDVCKLRNKLRRYQKRLYNTKKNSYLSQKYKKPTRAQ
ncbi:THAP domain-containing protein 2-like, partial [Temnothorax curvispinosus]|uniref:THAP domain-containing protein 2-like n=1 Tax=Temnothorax curvispinosus TaxID=300111 RepID=A0A6J1PNB0_9HYME